MSLRSSSLRKDNGSDGGALFTLLQNNNNNNQANQDNNNPNNPKPIPDTQDLKELGIELGFSTTTTLEKEDLVLRLRGELSAQTLSGTLDSHQLGSLKNDGYLVIPDALSPDRVELLLKEAQNTAERMFRGGEDVKVHSYRTEKDTFVSPVGRVIASLNNQGHDTSLEPLQRIQRIGCAVHQQIPEYRETIFTSFHVKAAKSLGYTDPRVTQSLIVVKAANFGKEIVPHHDGVASFTDPPSCTTFWYALQDATIENGCLTVAPGSHRTSPVTWRCVKGELGRPERQDLDKPLYALVDDIATMASPMQTEQAELEYKPLEVKAGTLILMHSNLMHRREGNYSSKSRVAFLFNLVEGEHGFLKDNYLHPQDGDLEQLKALRP